MLSLPLARGRSPLKSWFRAKFLSDTSKRVCSKGENRSLFGAKFGGVVTGQGHMPTMPEDAPVGRESVWEVTRTFISERPRNQKSLLQKIFFGGP